ncbi:hypothetical protein VC83_09622 [Pseudogymnoascus destructans]|uniref:Uncharacterized protein n=1 Tax=Pseudogymnoascus destructans TaxID=655981 RepID=A0A2P6FGJ6_9PEZI|nr:uncharacterized protein VC83_09622 [Pseudogymnoascus destructans]PQM43495.1 hypothetical protein VC83_09622 [Pseudogymnoascus destructans]
MILRGLEIDCQKMFQSPDSVIMRDRLDRFCSEIDSGSDRIKRLLGGGQASHDERSRCENVGKEERCIEMVRGSPTPFFYGANRISSITGISLFLNNTHIQH